MHSVWKEKKNLFWIQHAGIWLRPAYGMYVSYAFIALHFSCRMSFVWSSWISFTPKPQPQASRPIQVPPTLWLTTTNRKFFVHSPLACCWALNQRPLLLLEEDNNLTVSLKILVPFDHLLHIWSVIKFGNNWGKHGLGPLIGALFLSLVYPDLWSH